MWNLRIGLGVVAGVSAVAALGYEAGQSYALAALLVGAGAALAYYFRPRRTSVHGEVTETKVAEARLSPLSTLLALYSKSDEDSETLLYEKISELRIEGELTEYEARWLSRLKDLMELRALVFGRALKGKRGVRQAYAYAATSRPAPAPLDDENLDGLSLQDITECATVVADLYWKLYDTARGEYADLTKMARRLFVSIFDFEFESDATAGMIETLTDSMQRDRGLPYLILNCLRCGQVEKGRQLGQLLLSWRGELDEELRSTLYWMAEINWFVKERTTPLTDYETSIRYLYHLCFTNPERAGFLEIDSKFFSQFETVNELAREGFLFKDTLIEKVLHLWHEYEGLFDGSFQSVLESLTAQQSKIYSERDNWERFWRREGEDFSRDYLYVVEANLAYAGGFFEDAVAYYEKALELNPRLRSARLNLLFAYAKLKRHDRHERLALELFHDTTLRPSSLYVIGNSYLLLGDEKRAEVYYDELCEEHGWERKVDYYKSTFCYENGLFESALGFARRAHELNPSDSRINYHLSLCYDALGEKDRALDMVKRVNETPEWLDYYRFTLERDSGRHHEASATLLRIPSEYFEDPEEWQAAVEFARGQKDLTLLRHLKKR